MSGPDVGSEGPPFVVGPLTRTDFVRYAGASNDFNPLHHDDEYARAAGHPSVFAHGMFSAGLLASYLVAWFGPDSVRTFSVRFREPVWPGDVVTAKGVVTARDGDAATVTLELLRQTGRAAVTGEATVQVSRRR